MIENHKVALLHFGQMFAKLLQWASALAAGIVLLLIPIVILLGQDMLPGIGDGSRSATVEASPFTVVAIFSLLVLILAALFHFFGKLRALIVSAGEGDPFTPENAQRLNAMAWLFLGANILALLVGALRHRLANLVDKGAHDGNYLDVSLYDLDMLLIVILLFTLARIFRHGTAMRDDLRGTV